MVTAVACSVPDVTFVSNDAGTSDSALRTPPGDGSACVPVDAGILGALPLSQFTTAGVARYDEYQDGFIALTQGSHNLAGAAWYASRLPVLSSYVLTWTFREQPGGTAGAGFAFAVLQTATTPSSTFVGGNGAGMGLQNIPGGPTGYAVALYLYGGTEFELLAMPGFKVIKSVTTTDMLNDGSPYTVQVSWQAPSTLTAKVTVRSGTLTLTSDDAALTTTAPAWFGVTASTGAASNSINELAGITVSEACP
jgi:Bacterial lectin